MLVGVDEDDFDAADLLELATADPGRFEQQHVRARYAQPGTDQLPEPLGRAGSTTTWRCPSASTVQPLRSPGSRSSAWNAHRTPARAASSRTVSPVRTTTARPSNPKLTGTTRTRPSGSVQASLPTLARGRRSQQASSSSGSDAAARAVAPGHGGSLWTPGKSSAPLTPDRLLRVSAFRLRYSGSSISPRASRSARTSSTPSRRRPVRTTFCPARQDGYGRPALRGERSTLTCVRAPPFTRPGQGDSLGSAHVVAVCWTESSASAAVALPREYQDQPLCRRLSRKPGTEPSGHFPLLSVPPVRRRTGWVSGECGDPVVEGVGDLLRCVFGQEVQAGDGHLALVGPGSALPAQRAGEQRAGVAVEEQLGDGGGGHPPRVGGDDGVDVGGVAVDRDLAWPGQHRPSGFAGLPVGGAVGGHLVVGEGASGACGQDLRRTRCRAGPSVRPRRCAGGGRGRGRVRSRCSRRRVRRAFPCRRCRGPRPGGGGPSRSPGRRPSRARR